MLPIDRSCLNKRRYFSVADIEKAISRSGSLHPLYYYRCEHGNEGVHYHMTKHRQPGQERVMPGPEPEGGKVADTE